MGRLGKVRMKIVIYMPLLGDGTDCWRPVQAVQVTQDIFEVMDHIPEVKLGPLPLDPGCAVGITCLAAVMLD